VDRRVFLASVGSACAGLLVPHSGSAEVVEPLGLPAPAVYPGPPILTTPIDRPCVMASAEWRIALIARYEAITGFDVGSHEFAVATEETIRAMQG
jgi:hypothetical protein